MFEHIFGGPGGLIPNALQKQLWNVTLYIIALLVIIFILTPLYVLVIVSIQSPETLFADGALTLIPSEFSLENFVTLVEQTATVSYFINSMIITMASVFFSTSLAIISGYGLTRFDVTGKSIIARVVLFSYMVSPIVLAIPLYAIFNTLGLLNQYISAVLAVTTVATPFSIWLMWQYFQNIPLTYEESAWIRGASRWRAMRDVVLPLARPGYIAVAIFSFSVAWNDYTMVKVVLSDQSLYPITVGAELVFQEVFTGWGEQMALLFIMSFPPFLVAAFLQDYLLQGFNLGHR